jgi:arsenate reductase-like glutaredoxin family protein
MSNDEIYELLSEHPMLIKRPLVVDGDYVKTGFKEEDYMKQWL